MPWAHPPTPPAPGPSGWPLVPSYLRPPTVPWPPAFPAVGRLEVWTDCTRARTFPSGLPPTPFLKTAKCCHDNARCGGGEALTGPSQPMGPRAGEQSPSEPGPPPTTNKHHGWSITTLNFTSLLEGAQKEKKNKTVRRAARDRENNKPEKLQGAWAGEAPAGGRRRRDYPVVGQFSEQPLGLRLLQ